MSSSLLLPKIIRIPSKIRLVLKAFNKLAEDNSLPKCFNDISKPVHTGDYAVLKAPRVIFSWNNPKVICWLTDTNSNELEVTYHLLKGRVIDSKINKLSNPG